MCNSGDLPSGIVLDWGCISVSIAVLCHWMAQFLKEFAAWIKEQSICVISEYTIKVTLE